MAMGNSRPSGDHLSTFNNYWDTSILNDRFYNHSFIELLIVHPNYRRQGIGTTLIQAMEAACEESKLFTSTNDSNQGMQKLLSKIGYQRSGIIENLDEGDPELVYFKRLE